MKKYSLLFIVLVQFVCARAQYADTVTVGDKAVYYADFGANGSVYTWETIGGKIKQADPKDNRIEVVWGEVPGVYPLKVYETGLNMCSSDTVYMMVDVHQPLGLPSATVPNVFTPNGDGVNDLFVIVAKNYVSYNMKVFNRWGQTVFDGGTEKDIWDGRSKGAECPVGTYFYVLSMTNRVGTKTYKGFVAVER